MKFLKSIDVEYIITFFFLLLTANANFLSSNTIAWFVIMIAMILTGIAKRAFVKKDVQSLGIFSVGYLFFIFLRFYLFNELENDYLISDIVFLAKYILLSFIVYAILKDKTIAYIIKVVTHLTVLSFFFFAFQLLAANTLYKAFTIINFPTGNTIPGYTNFLVFTYTQGFHDFSNSGFVWEPGAFGCFLVITLMLHFFLTKFRFDAVSWILIIGNITTFSTTNYIGLLVLLFLAYRYRIPKINIWVLILLPTFALLIIFVPFLGGKIIDTYQEDMRDLNHLKVLEKYYKHNRMQIPLNRFSSMWYIIDTFGTKLILGVSNKYTDIVNKSYNINISNGIFDFLAKFGVLGFIYLLYRYLKFCKYYVLKFESLIYCTLVLLATSFGEPILILPIILIFIFIKNPQSAIVPLKKNVYGDV